MTRSVMIDVCIYILYINIYIYISVKFQCFSMDILFLNTRMTQATEIVTEDKGMFIKHS